jgi:enoyl-CoA hydratase/carnithine racemase
MREPLNLIRSDRINGYENKGALFEWSEGKALLSIDRVAYGGKPGALLCYSNPPVHQVGNPGLDAYISGLERLFDERGQFEFLILYGANDAVHAGGDLKESLSRLTATLTAKKEMEVKGVGGKEIDKLYLWADDRLKKGLKLYRLLRKISEYLRVVAVCGGGTRFGGSAEIPLMADYIVGDSRSGMCFSEAMIGLLPGWGGVGRTLTKAGMANAQYMAKTGREVKADKLKKIGIYNEVVTVRSNFPKKQKTDNPETDRKKYQDEIERHNKETGLLLLPAGLDMAVRPSSEIPVVRGKERLELATAVETEEEVARRVDPGNYSHIWGRPLIDVREEIAEMGRPLAPQSIHSLNKLFENYNSKSFDEDRFIEKEMEADAGLYRDARFLTGLTATLEQKVADYRKK